MSGLLPLLAAPALAAPDVDNLDAVLRAAADRGELVAAVQVVDGDQVLLDRVYGDAPPDPVCRIGSVSKSLTAATVYALADAGTLSLDTPIGDLLPRVHDRIGAGPTLRQLTMHQGGLSEPVANPWMPPPTWELQAATMLPQLSVEVPAGTRFRYSNFGYTLLSAAVSTTAEQSLEATMQHHILGPLAMADTGIAADSTRDARLLQGRIPTPIGLVDARKALPRLMPNDFRWPSGGAGALTSSPADLVRWAAALRDGSVLTIESRDALLDADPDSHYAAGWMVAKDGQIWHNATL